VKEETVVSEQAVIQLAAVERGNAAQERVSQDGRLVVTVDKWLGAVGEQLEVLPSLYGTVVLSYESGCQVWLRPVYVQSWAARRGE
jgi:hypothetical protein